MNSAITLPFLRLMIVLTTFQLGGGCDTAEPVVDISSIDEGVRLSPEVVLDRLAQTYGECKTYMDSGFVKETALSEGPKLQMRLEFHTVFQRAKRFRFAYRRRNPFNNGYDKARTLWHDGKQTMVNWGEPDEFEEEESLGLAVAGLTGVSDGTAHTIPALLIPKQISGRRIIELSDIQPLKSDVIDGKACYRIEGKYGADKTDSTVLWIDKESFLLVKIERKHFINTEAYLHVTSYSPSLDEEIPDRLFEKNIEEEWKEFEAE